MTDFVLDKQRFKEDSDTAIFKITNYARFLKQPLKLEMFVPCNEDGNVLEDIIGNGMVDNYSEKVKQYQQAKERVLFEGFTYFKDKEEDSFLVRNSFFKIHDLEFLNYTIEDLLNSTLNNIKLTKSAIKQLGLC